MIYLFLLQIKQSIAARFILFLLFLNYFLKFISTPIKYLPPEIAIHC